MSDRHIQQLVNAIYDVKQAWDSLGREGDGFGVGPAIAKAGELADDVSRTYCLSGVVEDDEDDAVTAEANEVIGPIVADIALTFLRSDVRPGLYAVEPRTPEARAWLVAEGFIAPNVFMLKETVARVSMRAKGAGFVTETKT